MGFDKIKISVPWFLESPNAYLPKLIPKTKQTINEIISPLIAIDPVLLYVSLNKTNGSNPIIIAISIAIGNIIWTTFLFNT